MATCSHGERAHALGNLGQDARLDDSRDDERRIIKAAARNKLGYHDHEIKQALLSM